MCVKRYKVGHYTEYSSGVSTFSVWKGGLPGFHRNGTSNSSFCLHYHRPDPVPVLVDAGWREPTTTTRRRRRRAARRDLGVATYTLKTDMTADTLRLFTECPMLYITKENNY